MSDPFPLLAPPSATPLASGAALALGEAGLRLAVAIPKGASLAEASLTLAAAPTPTAPRSLTFASDAEPALPATIPWLRASLEGEQAVTAIRIDGIGPGSARIRALSRGIWRPILPPDSLPVPTPRPVALEPFAASAVMVEFLKGFAPVQGAPQVFVPAPLAVTGLALVGTDQPCHLTVAIATDPPFFTQEGPFPFQPVEIVGLLRAANRFLAENPGAETIGLTLRAARPASLVLGAFRFALRPAPPVQDQAQPGSGTAATTPSPFPAEEVVPQAATAQLCDAAHWVAQRIDPPADRAIAGLDLYLATGAERLRARVSLHGGSSAPDDQPLAGAPELALELPAAQAPAWIPLAAPAPWRTPGPAWIVCRTEAGEALWFTARSRPAGIGAAMTRIGGAAWTSADAASPEGWAQLRLGLVPVSP